MAGTWGDLPGWDALRGWEALPTWADLDVDLFAVPAGTVTAVELMSAKADWKNIGKTEEKILAELKAAKQRAAQEQQAAANGKADGGGQRG
jgi:hypothetical protein